MQDFRIKDDGDREIRFTGELLGSAMTRENDSIRWTETNIWRTRAGTYILQKIGRSLVFHAAEGCKYGTKVMRFELPADAIPCPVCKPINFPESGAGIVKMETDRFSVHVSDTADGIVESVKLQDDDGVWYTPRVSKDALERAAAKDSNIREAYFVTVIE